MKNLLQPVTFKRLDQHRAWLFGYPEKTAASPALVLFCSHIPHLEFEPTFLFSEFSPNNKEQPWNTLLELFWDYLTLVPPHPILYKVSFIWGPTSRESVHLFLDPCGAPGSPATWCLVHWALILPACSFSQLLSASGSWLTCCHVSLQSPVAR